MLSDPNYLHDVVRVHRDGVASEVRRNRAYCAIGGACSVRWADVASTWHAAVHTTAAYFGSLVRL